MRIHPRELEHVIFDKPVMKNHYPIFEVQSAGKTIEMTSHHATASAAFHNARATPVQLLRIDSNGRKTLLDQTTRI